jgi:hypothetical protein
MSTPITVTTLTGPVSPTSNAFLVAGAGEHPIDPAAYGRINAEDISPSAVAAFSTNKGGIYDVMQVACQGNLYVVLGTKANGNALYAPVNFMPSMEEEPGETCEEAAVPYVPAGGPTAAPVSDANSIIHYTTFIGVVVLNLAYLAF